MKKIFTVFLFAFIVSNVYSQTWKELTTSGQGFDRSGAFNIGDTVYYVVGSGYNNSMWSYDTSSKNWSQVTSFPTNNVDGLVACSLNGLGYAGMGVASFNFTNSFYKYDPNAGPGGGWTQFTSCPCAPRAYGLMFALDGKIYMGGGLISYPDSYSGTVNYQNGYSGTPYNDFWVYNPSNNTWDSIKHCPAKGVNCDPVCFVIGDKAYVGTGGSVTTYQNGASTPQNDFWEYDTTSKVWTQIASIPGNRAEASAFSTCDRGYCGLGYTDYTRTHDDSDFYEYFPNKDRWIRIANFGGGPRNAALAFAVGKTGYVVSGVRATGGNIDDFWSYTGAAIPAFSADTSTCQGGSIIFTDTSLFGPDHWSWQFEGGSPASSSSPNPTVTYNTIGKYGVTVTAWNDCDSGTTVFTQYIKVNAGPSITVTPDSPSVCKGQTIPLTVNGGIGATYQWVNTTNTTDSIHISPKADTSYEVRVSTTGCSIDTFIQVKLKSPPALFIQPQYPSLCDGSSIFLTVPASGSNYQWGPSLGLNKTSSDSVVANPTAISTYWVSGTDSLGCSVTDTDIITVNTPIVPPTIRQKGNTLISSYTQGNTWTLNGSAISANTDSSIIITQSGCYQVTETNSVNGCSATSDSDCVTGIAQLPVNSNQITVYPDPTSGTVSVNIKVAVNGLKDLSLQVTDVLGRTLFIQQSLNYTNEVDLSKFASGIYFISVLNSSGRTVLPIVKQ